MYFGRAVIGWQGAGNEAALMHRALALDGTNYAIKQLNLGDTYLNCSDTKQIYFRRNNATITTLDELDALTDGGETNLHIHDDRYYTEAEVDALIGGGGAGHLHDGDTLQLDGINSDGGAFSFSTAGTVTFTQSLVLPADGSIGVTDGSPQIVFDNTNNWLEITGDVGIGATSSVAHVNVENATLNFTGSYRGFRNTHIKTSGASDESSDFYGLATDVTLNQAGGTVGHLTGFYSSAELVAGTIGDGQEDLLAGTFLAKMSGGTANRDVLGMYGLANLDAGTIAGDVYAMKFRVDIDPEVTSIGGNVYGTYIQMAADKAPVGSVYMLYLWEQSGTIDYGIYQNGSADNYFGGNVGIGTSSPSALLHIYGSSAILRIQDNDDASSYFQIEDSSSTVTVLEKHSNSGNAIIFFDPLPLDGSSNAVFSFFRNTDTTGNSYTNWYIGDGSATTNARIAGSGLDTYFAAQSGKVGIGTTSPDTKLHVHETADASMVFTLSTDGDIRDVYIDFIGDANGAPVHQYVGLDKSKSNAFLGPTVSSLVVDSSGNVGIGTTSPAAQLHVDQASTSGAIPVLTLDQADVSEGTINFIASERAAITGATDSAKSVRVELNGTVYRLALYADA